MISRFGLVLCAVVAITHSQAVQVAAQDCEHIEWRSPTPFGYSFNDVVFGNGVFLAPAGMSHVAISTDGASWTLQRVSTSETGLWKATWDGSQFILTSNAGRLYTSPDGIDWTLHHLNGALQTMSAVASRGGSAVASDILGQMVHTTDWQTWSVVYYAPQDVNAMAASNSEFIAVGDYTLILRSVDGSTWSDVSPSLPSGVALEDVMWNGTYFLAVGVGGHTFRSTNGLVWEEGDTGYSSPLRSVTWDGSRFVVSSFLSSQVFSSLDGLSWTYEVEIDPEHFTWGIAWGNQRYVIVGSFGVNLSSTDRSTWIPHYSGPYEILRGVANSGSKLVAVGESGTTMSSATGRDWAAHSLPQTVDLYGVVWSGTEFLAVGEVGALWASATGETWLERPIAGVAATLYEIIAADDLVAVGAAGTIVTSADGSSWTPVNSTVSTDLHAVASNGSVYVAVGDGGTIVTSPDAASWTERASGTTRDLRTILWDGSNFYATGHNGDLVVSSDGISWTDGDPITNPNGSMTYDLELYRGTYVAANSFGIMTSPDMTSWSVRSEWDTFYALAPSTTGLVAVGLHGYIIGLECWGIIFSDGFESGSTSNWAAGEATARLDGM